MLCEHHGEVLASSMIFDGMQHLFAWSVMCCLSKRGAGHQYFSHVHPRGSACPPGSGFGKAKAENNYYLSVYTPCCENGSP